MTSYDSGQWGINGVSDGLAAHEFTHFLGVDNHNDGPYLSNTLYDSGRLATDYDYGWAFGGAINDHREASRPIEMRGILPANPSGIWGHGQPRSYTSTRKLSSPVFWWR